MVITNTTLNQFTETFTSHLAQHGITAHMNAYAPLSRKESMIRVGFNLYRTGNNPDTEPLRFFIGLIDPNKPAENQHHAQAFIRDITIFDDAYIKQECDELKQDMIHTIVDARTLAKRCEHICDQLN